MKSYTILFFILFFTNSFTVSAQQKESILMVRHGETVDGNSHSKLSKEGVKRAWQWRDISKLAEISTIYIDGSSASSETANEIARDIDVEIHHLPENPEEWSNELEIASESQRILVISRHENLVPITSTITNNPASWKIPESWFHMVFIFNYSTKNSRRNQFMKMGTECLSIENLEKYLSVTI